MVENAATQDLKLTERDVEILGHIRRFRMTTSDVLHRLFFKGNEIDAVKSWVRRLRDADYLQTADLITPRKYLYLRPKAVRKLYGESGKMAKALGVFALARQFGILSFCCLGETAHRKLTVFEFKDMFPSLADNSLPKDFYYVDKSGATQRLGFIYVDHGCANERIYQRYRHIVAQRYRIAAWRQEVIEPDRFTVAIVTAKPEKKKRIEEVFAERKPMVPYCVEAVPDLIHLV